MRVRLLVIWITLTALLQWSRAQEDNIQEVSLSGGVESTDPDEQKSPGIKDNMNISPTTDMPEVKPLIDSATEPQVEQQDHHQSGEDKMEPADLGLGTQDMPSDGSQISVMSAEETTTGSIPPIEVQDQEKPTNQGPSSAEADILKKPPTSPVKSTATESPDYQEDAPYENNSLQVETTPPAPTPAPTTAPTAATTATPTPPPPAVLRPQSCYSCLDCNATVTDDQKTTCKTAPGDRNGCYTMLVKDKNLVPDKKNYVERGCSSELSPPFLLYCKANKDLCKKCDGNYCNVYDMTSLQETTAGGTSPRVLESLLIGGICLVNCWRRQVFY
ncbi:hypothetical protein KR059_006020 [Drosophila kikkawai]|nr:hypothetical protein KR059_006020 [Drosophila kikkawai]